MYVLEDYKTLVSQILLVLACVVFIVGIWGIAACKLSNKLFIAALGTGLTGVTIALAACASLFWSLKNIDDKTMESICTTGVVNTDQSTVETGDFTAAVKELDQLNGLASFMMCSPVCPCKDGPTSSQWLELDQKELIQYERTADVNSQSAFQKLIFLSEAEADKTTTFATFDACVTSI